MFHLLVQINILELCSFGPTNLKLGLFCFVLSGTPR